MKELPFCSRCCSDTLEEIYYSLTHRYCKKGETIIPLNAFLDGIIFIVQGSIQLKVLEIIRNSFKIEIESTGKIEELEILEEGSILNIYGTISETPASFGAYAYTPLTIFSIKKADLNSKRHCKSFIYSLETKFN